MSKYENDLISKRDLLSALCDKYIYDDRIPVLPSDYLCAQRETLQQIRDFPTLDAVRVVRCGDCVHGDNYCDKCGFWTYCNIQGTDPVKMRQDDFCSYGERRCSELD